MPKKARAASATKTELASLQKLVVDCLTSELQEGLASGQVNQATIRNALQMLRDNDVVATEEICDEFERIASLLPKIDADLVVSATRRYS